MIICIAGKNDIAINCAKYVLSLKKYDLIGIVNRNDNGEDGYYFSYKKFLKENSIQIVDLEDIYKIEKLYFFSVEFDRILKIEKFVSQNLFNIHFSLLPKYKGVYTSAIPILNGENESGVTLHKIDNGIDTGDIIEQVSFKIFEDDTCDTLYRKYMKYGFEVFKRNLEKIICGKVKFQKQNYEYSTYHSKKYIDYQNLKIDLNKTAWQIKNQIRAFYCPAFQIPEVHGFKIFKAEILNRKSYKKPGTILENTEKYMIIATVDYDLKLLKVKGKINDTVFRLKKNKFTISR